MLGYAGVVGDMDVSGSAVVWRYECCRNADICGNVLLTSGSSAVQQVHIRATTASTDTISGALVVAGGAGISGKVNINDNMDVSSCFVGALGQLVSVQATPVYVGFHDGGFYQIH
jgi:hypothetical protein